MSEIPTADWTWIDAAAIRFEQEWKKGTRPRIEYFLAEVDESRWPQLLEELLRVERELLHRAGAEPDAEEYRRRFPDSAALIDAVFGPEPDRSAATGPRHPGPDPTTTGPIPTGGDTNGDQEPAPGTRVRYFGDYELIREIGRGGMGIVYKARQISLNRPVALKMIRSAALATDDELRRFQNEAEAIALLDHPHIVPILEVGNHEHQRYFSMKLIGGASLDKKLADYATDPKSAASLMQKAAVAVHHAHQRGILHRDLKPANILLDEHGDPVVTDFGLAKRVVGDSELTYSGTIVGTPAYMAPEQASGRRGSVTTSSDVYGLGAILYALLTGRAPFGGDSIDETLEQVRQSVPAPPSRINPRTPRDLEVICLKCLEKDPARRYASSQALAEDLGRYLLGEPIAARATGMLERGWLWCRRNPWLAGAFGSAAAALVAVAVVSVLYARGQARSREEIAGIAKDLKRSLDDSEALGKELQTSLITSNRRLAVLHYERGQTAFEKGQTGQGLLEMIETWRSAVAAGDHGWQHTARANVAAWQSHNIGLKAVFSHRAWVRSVAFSPDGKAVLTGSSDGTAQLWDAATGEPIGQPLEHQNSVMAVAFSPDGRAVLTSSYRMARLWDAATGKPIGPRMAHQDEVRAVVFSPDGKTVLTGSDDYTARLWDAATGKPIGAPLAHKFVVRSVAFSPDGKAVLTGSWDKTARLWDAATGKPIGPPLEHQDGVNAVAFSPDGKAILTGSGYTARLWDAPTGKPIGPPLDHKGAVVAVAFSPDGRAVLTGSDDYTARLWDAATGKPIGAPLAHKGRVRSVAFGPDGKAVLTGSQDKTARLWDAATGQPVGPPLEHQDEVGSVAFGPDGKAVLTGSQDKPARLWDAAAGQSIGPPLEHQGLVIAVAFSPDGRAVLTGSADYTARLWDAATGKPIWPPLTHKASVWAVAFSPDGKAVLTGSEDGTARLWDSATGRPIGLPLDHKGAVVAVAFSPDGRAVLTGSADYTARLWDAATGKLIGAPLAHKGRVRSVAFSPDGKAVLTGSEDGTAQLWDAATGKPIGRHLTHQDVVDAAVFSPDGKVVLIGSGYTARLWGAAGKPIGPPLEHQGMVKAVAFSPDGKAVLTGSQDKTARLWDAATGKPIGPPLEHRDAVHAVAFSPDGKAVLTGSWDKTARLWDAATGKPIGPPLEHQGMVWAVAFSPDGKAVLTGSFDKTARLWAITELPDDLPRLTTWVEVVTGLELDGQGLVRTLDSEAWRQRRERLDREGGPPETGKKWRLDPILFGSEPTARSRVWIERERWAEAEAAFNEVVLARPLNSDVLLERARFHASRSRPDKADDDLVQAYALGSRDSKLVETIAGNEALFRRAIAKVPDSAVAMRWSQRGDDHARRQRWAEAAADFGQAGRLQPEDPTHGQREILSHAAAGDLDEVRRVRSDLLKRFGTTTNPYMANVTAWYATLAPGSDAHADTVVRLAELAVNGEPDASLKGDYPNTLGAALDRAGRFEDAIRRLEEGIRLRNGTSPPQDWVFLAMAHHRLGRRDQARIYLERLRSRRPSTDPNQFWNELEIRLLQNEAEATILYDPVFPADPFAH